jgi:hypothetical protein
MTGSAPSSEDGSASVSSPTSAAESPANADAADLLHAYELAQKHYDSDLQLFSARMNLFLLVQSALVTVAGSAILGSKADTLGYRGPTSLFGLILAVGWLFVAISSYAWVKTWRAHMMIIGGHLQDKTKATFSAALFHHGIRKEFYPKDKFWPFAEAFSWIVRPTLVTCCLPLLFIMGWVYLGIRAHWSGI